MRHELLDKLDAEVFIFDSINEQADAAYNVRNTHSEYVEEPKHWAKRKNFIGRQMPYDWTGTLAMVKGLWEQGMQWYDEMIAELRKCDIPQPKSIRRQRVYREDEGDELSLDRLQRGLPYWQTTHRDHRPGPLSVTIIIQVGALSTEKSRDLIWRGVAALALAEVLEQAGYRCEIWTVSYVTNAFTSGKYDRLGICTLQKRGEDPINPSAMINAVSGWFHRTIKFACNKLGKGLCSPSCGGTASIPQAVIDLITTDSQTVVCQDIYNKQAALDWAKEQLATMIQ